MKISDIPFEDVSGVTTELDGETISVVGVAWVEDDLYIKDVDGKVYGFKNVRPILAPHFEEKR